MPHDQQDLRWLREFIAGEFAEFFPYYAAILEQWDLTAWPAVPVMGVTLRGGRVRLIVNNDYWADERRRNHYLAGVVQHEVHHVVLGHLTNRKLLDPLHPRQMLLAKEISANEYIKSPLPSGPSPAFVIPTVSEFARYGIDDHQSTEMRYRILCEVVEKFELPHTWSFDQDLVRQQMQEAAEGSSLDIVAMIEDAIESVELARKNGTRRFESPWRDRLAGREPGKLIEELDEPDPGLATVDWRQAIKRLVDDLYRRRQLTRRRPSRRVPHLVGVVPGRATQEAMHPNRILVAIDTSGSMTTDDINMVAAELNSIKREFPSLAITVVQCDESIHTIQPFTGRIDRIFGRGGTSLKPVFEPSFLEKMGERGEPVRAIIYFTDGCGPYPDNPPQDIKTLWVLTSQRDAETFECPWGEKAVMQSNHQE